MTLQHSFLQSQVCLTPQQIFRSQLLKWKISASLREIHYLVNISFLSPALSALRHPPMRILSVKFRAPFKP